MKKKQEKPFQVTFVIPTRMASVHEPLGHDYNQT